MAIQGQNTSSEITGTVLTYVSIQKHLTFMFSMDIRYEQYSCRNKIYVLPRAYRLLKEKRACNYRHLAKFKSRLKIVKPSVCIVQSRQLLLL